MVKTKRNGLGSKADLKSGHNFVTDIHGQVNDFDGRCVPTIHYGENVAIGQAGAPSLVASLKPGPFY